MDTSISFSKIVATPTLNSWSQVYNAGKLFAVLSLEKTEDQNQIKPGQNQDIGSLNILGRSLLDRLEQEFFTTETKDLESIKKAILSTFENITNTVVVSFVLGFFSEDILYLFILGKGNVFIKRDGLGNILSSSDENPKNIVSSSGFVKDNDLIILGTFAFSKAVTPDLLSVSLETGLPTDATEALAPKIHKVEDGRLAAIIIKYNKPRDVEENIDTLDQDNKIENETLSNDSGRKLHNIKERVGRFLSRCLSLFKSKIRINSFRANSRKIVLLIAAVAIAVILISNIFLAIKNQNNAKINALFSQVYEQAQKKYDEGNSLLDLNKNLARDSFLSAQKILNDNKSKFPPKSKDEKQILDLLSQVNNKLSQVDTVEGGIDRSKLSVSVQNGSGIEGTAGKGAEILKEFGYNVVSTENADNYNYIGVTIKVKKDKSNFLELLKKDLSKNYKVTFVSSDLPSSSPTDALIIIGK